jgi:cathepsin F
VRGQELQVIKEWERFKIMYKKNYTKLEEEERRFKIFEENLKRTEELCSRDPFADYGVTQFMDLTPEEFRSKYLMNDVNFTIPHPNEYFDVPHVDPSLFPPSFDW